MSVIMTLHVSGNPTELEKHADGDQDGMASITEMAKNHGLIAHRFYGSGDDQIMVIDEWPDEESFQAFFGEAQERIQSLMQAAAVSSEPQVTFWHKLETHDEVGWGA